MPRVLITGIAGFIGSNLAHALLDEGASVRGIDNLSTGRVGALASIRSRIDLREASILDRTAMEDACRDVDYLFHLAAIPCVPVSVADPSGTHAINLTGTLAVLEAAKRANVKRLIFASSSAAYGDGLTLPKREDMTPSPVSPYAVQKVASEQYLATYTRLYGLETVSLRYFNVFGPWQNPASEYSGVLARFISRMSQGEAPCIFGDGSTTRDFVYIGDVVRATMLAATTSAPVAGMTFNIATGRGTSILTAFDSIKRILGYKGDVKFQPERAGDVRHSVADISLAQATFGYHVNTDFDEGLRKTVQWCREFATDLERHRVPLAKPGWGAQVGAAIADGGRCNEAMLSDSMRRRMSDRL